MAEGGEHAGNKRVGESRHASQQRAAMRWRHAHNYSCIAADWCGKLFASTIKFDYIINAVLQI